ncbi:MAG: hypothetical protein MI919_33530, partial [Holophagales bacterium]|nr:hypothetical protein [Holophagales bacterium]
IPAALGAILALGLVRLLAHARRRLLMLGALGVGAALGLFQVFRRRLDTPDLSDPASLQAILDTLGRSQNPFLPSQWLAEGVLATATGDWSTATFSLFLLVSNAAFCLYLATLAAEAWFPGAWSALLSAGESGSQGRRRVGVSKGILGRLDTWLRPLPEPIRSLTVKDLRLFWREPSQWSQFLLFFGIMAVYLANLDRDRGVVASLDPRTWQAWGTLLNLGACLLILASLTTRFIFPLISLEGRRFWILGLSPVTLRTVVWQKLGLSMVATSVFTVPVTMLSAVKLGLSPLAFALSVGTVACATLALSGLAVGLGGLYPNFEEDNPSRIVSGLGGTLNFLASMFYVVIVSAAMGTVLLWHDLEARFGADAFPQLLAGAVAVIVASTLVATLVPLRLGLRHLENLEI